MRSSEKSVRRAKCEGPPFQATSLLLKNDMVADTGTVQTTSPPATAVAHAWLRGLLNREIEAEALRRQQHVDQLTGRILTIAIVLGLVNRLVADADPLLSR